jgi:hypothetical protein
MIGRLEVRLKLTRDRGQTVREGDVPANHRAAQQTARRLW